MALGSNRDKQPTKQEILLRAQELDDRRQVQINRQIRIINRLVEENTAMEGVLREIAEGEVDSENMHAADALALVAAIRERCQHEDAEWEKEQEKK